MDDSLKIRHDLAIAMHELEFIASRAGGPGGQHVNKTSTKISVRWNIINSASLLPLQKERLLVKLANKITQDGDLIVHSSASRSQQQNKLAAIANLAQIVRQALHVPKKRMKTRAPKSAVEKRLESKARHGSIKKMRNNKNFD